MGTELDHLDRLRLTSLEAADMDNKERIASLESQMTALLEAICAAEAAIAKATRSYSDDEIRREVLKAGSSGNWLNAIKRYRELVYGATLKDAKDYVDTIRLARGDR